MHDDQTSDRGAWLVLGGIRLLNRTAPRHPDEPIVLVRVPPQEVCRPATTVVVRWNALGLCPADALRPGGARFGSTRINGGLDRCSLLAAPEVVLSQCELEYLRSRSILDHDQDEVLHEMERISDWLRGYLSSRGWATEYSKRSCLRHAVDLRPELAPAMATPAHGNPPQEVPEPT
ncbi:hypothetical protein ACFY2M_26235 [Streptomyces sp. NPDC001276]|uniref:hypothetical protein n=1 Tax=Streptomyces sp. NPDC001276 TaxID=3364555 RepID=UPI0036C5C79D